MCDAREPYTNLRDLMARTGAKSTSTVSKAIKSSITLSAWQARKTKRTSPPHAVNLTDSVEYHAHSDTKYDPSDITTDEKAYVAMARFIDEARRQGNTDEIAKLNSMTDDECRELAKVYYAQNQDNEPSPLEPDPPGTRPRKVIHHKQA